MRRSSDSGDPGYQDFMAEVRQGILHKILLNGEEQKCVFVADENEGFIERAVLDADGMMQIDPNNQEEVWRERAEGNVKIILVPGGRNDGDD